jgi:HSP20 family molecular chaperone IbpA
VFNEAEEVLIVVDLGGFTRGEISLTLSPRQYVLHAVRGDQRFDEVIDVPPNVDAERSQERLVNGVLEIVLPRTEVHRTPRTATRHSRKQHRVRKKK